MRLLLPLLLVAACKKQTTETPAPEPAPEPVVEPAPAPLPPPPQPIEPAAELTDEQLAGVARKLSVRDPEPVCATMESEMATDPLDTWLAVIDRVSQPPFAPMRAAGCVIRNHPEAAQDTLVVWVTDETKQGLGRLVLANLDKLPEAVAERVKTAAKDGPLAGELD